MTASTFITYNIHRFIGQRRIPSNAVPDRIKAITEFGSQIIVAVIASMVVVCYTFLQFTMEQILLLIPVGVITASYVLPTVGQLRLRDIPFFKIFILSIVWAYIFILPLLFTGSNLGLGIIVSIVCLEKFLFFFALTLPFDQRDVQVDKLTNVSTIPSHFGVKRTMGTALGTIAMTIATCCYLYYVDYYSIALLIAITAFYVLLIPLIYYSQNKSDLYFLGILDGSILINGLLYVMLM